VQAAVPAAARAAGLAVAFGHTFWWCVGFTALAVIPALLMPGRPPASPPAGPPEPRPSRDQATPVDTAGASHLQ
jgi:hypothetical protein